MQSVPCAHLSLRPLQLSERSRTRRGGQRARIDRRGRLKRSRTNSMKLKELALKLGLDLRGDGAIDVFAPAPIEAAGPGTVIFVASEKYLPALETTRAACAIITRELAPRAKCAAPISAHPSYHFSRARDVLFPP